MCFRKISHNFNSFTRIVKKKLSSFVLKSMSLEEEEDKYWANLLPLSSQHGAAAHRKQNRKKFFLSFHFCSKIERLFQCNLIRISLSFFLFLYLFRSYWDAILIRLKWLNSWMILRLFYFWMNPLRKVFFL